MYKIAYDSKVGRYLAATRDIEPGQLIIDEPSIVDGPSIDTSISSPSNYTTKLATPSNLAFKEGTIDFANIYVCPACYKKLPQVDDYSGQGSSFAPCSRCNLILCSTTCSDSKIHSGNECLIFCKLPNLLANIFKSSSRRALLCQFITTVRCLFLKSTDEFKWKQLKQLQSNVEEFEELHVFDEIDEGFSLLDWEFFREQSSTVESEESIIHDAHRCLGILRTNSFSQFTPTLGAERLFFFTSFMSHDCRMNTERVFATVEDNVQLDNYASTSVGFEGPGRMITRAARKINKNDSITTTYLSYLGSTDERQLDMRRVWNFNCTCERCQDPTECSTHLSTVKCPTCSLLTLSPFYSPQSSLVKWVCSNTECKYSTTDELEVELILENTVIPIELEKPKLLTNLDETENWLKIFDTHKLVHTNHSIFLQAKYFLCQYYGTSGEDGLNGLSNERLLRKAKYCRQVVNVFDKFFDGIYLFKGTVLFHLWLSLKEILIRKLNCSSTEDELGSDDLFTSSMSETTISDLLTPEGISRIADLAYLILQFGRPNTYEELMANVLQANDSALLEKEKNCS